MAGPVPMIHDDLDRIMAVMNTAFDPAFGEAWTRAQVEGALLMGNCHYQLIAADGNRPMDGETAAGFALLRTVLEEEELLLFAIDPRWRRQGLGTKLLQWIDSDARSRGIRRILLEMRHGNSAESLYKAHGFDRIGLRPNYYRLRDGACIDAITFCNILA